jgi:histidine triad (HIT) family protein
MAECVFCKIVAGQVPAAKVYDDADILAFMDIGQVNPGHVVVAVKPHRETVLDLDDRLAGRLFAVAAKVARAADRAFAPAGFTLLQANKPAGWQTVPHVHVHVLPRHADDGVTLGWPRKNPPSEELRRNAERIVAAMER